MVTMDPPPLPPSRYVIFERPPPPSARLVANLLVQSRVVGTRNALPPPDLFNSAPQLFGTGDGLHGTGGEQEQNSLSTALNWLTRLHLPYCKLSTDTADVQEYLCRYLIKLKKNFENFFEKNFDFFFL